MTSLLDRYIGEFDVIERFERRINAPPAVVMRVAYDFDLQSIWLIKLIIWLRRKFLRAGDAVPRKPLGLVAETRELGWGTLIEEPGKLLVCGAVCQPWFGDVKFVAIPEKEFAAYDVPDQVKIAWSLEAYAIEPGMTLFVHEVRARATDEEAERKFMRYWRWARFGIVEIRLLLLPAIRRRAERELSPG